MFDSMMFKINSLNKEEILKYTEKRANLSDICIGHYNERKDVEGFSSKDLYQMMGNSEKKKALSNALAFKVGAVYGLGDEAVKGLMRKIEGDEVLSLPERGENAITTKFKMKGFTVVELMIAVAVVGLVTTMAVPVYQTHVAKAQVSEGINLADGIKAIVDEYHSNNGSFPKSGDVVGAVNTSGKYVGNTSIGDNGAIVTTFGNDVVKGLEGKYVALTPSVEKSGNLSWECSSNAPKDYLPKSCQSVGSGGNTGTTEPSKPVEPSVDTWSADIRKLNSNMFMFNFTNRYSDIGKVTYVNDGSNLAYGTQRLKLENGAVYSVDFLAKDGTIVFKLDSGPDDYSFLAIGANQSQIGLGNIAYVKKGGNTIDVSSNQNSVGTQTSPAKTVDATKTQWLNDYMNSTQFAEKNK